MHSANSGRRRWNQTRGSRSDDTRMAERTVIAGLDVDRYTLRQRLRSVFFGSGRTLGPLKSVHLARWAEGLYLANDTDQPLNRSIFAIEQLEMHARGLAASHRLGHRRGRDQLLKRLTDSELVISRTHDLMSRARSPAQA